MRSVCGSGEESEEAEVVFAQRLACNTLRRVLRVKVSLPV